MDEPLPAAAPSQTRPQTGPQTSTRIGPQTSTRIDIEVCGPTKRAVTRGSVLGLSLSLALHVSLLIAFALLRWSSSAGGEGGLITVVQGESDDGATFETLVDLSDPEPESERPVPVVEPQPMEMPEVVLKDTGRIVATPTQPARQTIAPSTPPKQPAAAGAKLAAPENAVQQGSFTAWTKPIGPDSVAGTSPAPWQPYHIVIEIRLPEQFSTYRLYDLSGIVEGSDTYVQKIPDRNTFFYDERGRLTKGNIRSRVPVRDHTVQLLVEVPGASTVSVRDRIELRSRLLKESETLLITFE